MAIKQSKLSAYTAEILRLAGEQVPSRDIAKHLHDKHGLKVSFQTVADFIKARRSETADVSKAVLREAVTPTLSLAAQHLVELVVSDIRLYKATARLAMDEETGEVTSLEAMALCPKLSAAAVKAIEAQMKAAGVDQPDDPTSATLASFFAELERSAKPH